MLKRFDIENYCHFVTTRTYNDVRIFQKKENTELFLRILYEVKGKLNFLLIAFVIMLDHLHLMIVPDRRNTISDVMRHFKGRFARFYNKSRRMNSADYGKKVIVHRTGNLSPSEAKIWQEGFYDHVIRNKKEFLQKLNYIHNNPVTAGMVAKPEDYKFSSASGIYKIDLERYYGG